MQNANGRARCASFVCEDGRHGLDSLTVVYWRFQIVHFTFLSFYFHRTANYTTKTYAYTKIISCLRLCCGNKVNPKYL